MKRTAEVLLGIGYFWVMAMGAAAFVYLGLCGMGLFGLELGMPPKWTWSIMLGAPFIVAGYALEEYVDWRKRR